MAIGVSLYDFKSTLKNNLVSNIVNLTVILIKYGFTMSNCLPLKSRIMPREVQLLVFLHEDVGRQKKLKRKKKTLVRGKNIETVNFHFHLRDKEQQSFG